MPKSLAEEHSELFHYTSVRGLEGILKSQMLRATHAAYLNDTTELYAFKERLPSILAPSVESGINSILKKDPKKTSWVESKGGVTSLRDNIAAELSNLIYSTLNGSNGSAPFVEPFIMSFCTTKSVQIAKSGLLSQWRGYGKEGGYAIVFDTEGLGNLLAEEGKKEECGLFAGDVLYSSANDDRFRNEFGDDTNKLQTAIENYFLSDGNPTTLGETYDPIMRCACRYKHWGFEEEAEVRLVAIPNSKVILEAAAAEGVDAKTIKVSHFTRGGLLVPCIYLFESLTNILGKPLPIKRIIVGPHKDKEKRKHSVENLLYSLNLNVPVKVSEIPYIELA
jgi:hypothetical protein